MFLNKTSKSPFIAGFSDLTATLKHMEYNAQSTTMAYMYNTEDHVSISADRQRKQNEPNLYEIKSLNTTSLKCTQDCINFYAMKQDHKTVWYHYQISVII